MPDHSRMTSEERTKKNYERRPYPRTEINLLVEKDTSLPASRWMQAVGRPGHAAPKRVLVAGCATGVEAFILRRRWPTAEIVAVDFSPRSIAVARKLQRTVVTGKPITFLVADLTDENLVQTVGGDFDLITCHGVLSYIPEPARVMRNLGPCLRADGALYLGVNGEAHPATRLRSWLAGFGLAVDELRDERRLRELLGLWDALNDDGSGELATMSASYLGGDVCGAHFNNWPLARWRAEANAAGWEIAGTDILPLALHLTIERKDYRPLYPAGAGELAARLDHARPAGFHRIMLRRASAGGMDLVFDAAPEQRLRWTGLYGVTIGAVAGRRAVKAVLRCPMFHVRVEWTLTPAQAAALRAWVAAGISGEGQLAPWTRTQAGREMVWVWAGLGAVAVDPTVASRGRE
jgi:SAM-dependent methyltransferase